MNNTVFQDTEEIDRLAVQFRLLLPYEQALFDKIFDGKKKQNVLDIGCNDGTKTFRLFSGDSVSKIIGLEYSDQLAEKAQQKYGSASFSFYQCDVDSPDFSEKIRVIMQENDIESFDVIYISFVLMHLNNPKALLSSLREFLSPNGCLVSIEANDRASILKPDEDHLLDEFLDMLEVDPYAGNRNTGSVVPTYLQESGYEDVCIDTDLITAGVDETQKKNDIFETFFSYFPKDVELLLQEEPNSPCYNQWAEWLKNKYKLLEFAVLNASAEISMGVRILSCKRG